MLIYVARNMQLQEAVINSAWEAMSEKAIERRVILEQGSVGQVDMGIQSRGNCMQARRLG